VGNASAQAFAAGADDSGGLSLPPRNSLTVALENAKSTTCKNSRIAFL
jgi:hypothetical protein